MSALDGSGKTMHRAIAANKFCDLGVQHSKAAFFQFVDDATVLRTVFEHPINEFAQVFWKTSDFSISTHTNMAHCVLDRTPDYFCCFVV